MTTFEEPLLEEPSVDPMDGLHTTVVIRWEGNPAKYVLHVQSAIGREALNEFLPKELKRIAKALREEPIVEEDVTSSEVVDEAVRSTPYIDPSALLAEEGV